MPFVWFLSRLCDEFQCLPSAALAEWERAPVGLLEEILEARGFAKAKDLYDHAKSKTDLPSHPMIDLVQAVEFELVEEELAARKKGTA